MRSRIPLRVNEFMGAVHSNDVERTITTLISLQTSISGEFSALISTIVWKGFKAKGSIHAKSFLKLSRAESSRELMQSTNEKALELGVKWTIHLISFLSESKDQFKQIVLSAAFEFYWAKLSCKLTEGVSRSSRVERAAAWNLFIAFLAKINVLMIRTLIFFASNLSREDCTLHEKQKRLRKAASDGRRRCQRNAEVEENSVEESQFMHKSKSM